MNAILRLIIIAICFVSLECVEKDKNIAQVQQNLEDYLTQKKDSSILTQNTDPDTTNTNTTLLSTQEKKTNESNSSNDLSEQKDNSILTQNAVPDTMNTNVTHPSTQDTFNLGGIIEFTGQTPSSIDILMNEVLFQFSKTDKNEMIPFQFKKMAYKSDYDIKITNNVEFDCTQLSGTLLDNASNLKITCQQNVLGDIFSAVKNGDNTALNDILNREENYNVMDQRLASIKDYAAAKKIVDTETHQETSVYLYAKYLLSLDSNANSSIHKSLNDSLQKLLLRSLKVDEKIENSVFTVTGNDITSLNIESTACKPCATGSIPSAIGNLTELKVLNLTNDKKTGVVSGLTGAIPTEIENLHALTVLNLSHNKLEGVIPSNIGTLTKLVNLFLDNNQLTGSIPREIFDLKALTSLNLANNKLEGIIPKDIGNLITLQHLNLANNQLGGSIPQEIGNLTKLVDLSLTSNKLGGPIPPELGSLKDLTSANISSNQLEGSIPPEIGNLTHLNSLDISGNQLEGSIPSEIENLTHLEKLYYTGNSSLSLSYDTKQKLTALKTSDLFSLVIESTGLSTGESVTVTLNNTEPLTIAGNKTTNFKTSFISKDPFTLKISSATPSMTCALSQTTGTITQDLVVALTCERRMLQLSGTIEFDVKAPSSLAVSMDDSSPTTFSRSIANNKVIPFTFSNIVYGSSYTIKTTDNTVEFNCTPPDTQTLNNDVSDLKVTCKNTIAGSIFAYVQDGNNSDLSTLLAKTENIGAMDIRIPSTGNYKDVRKIIDTKDKKETSIYLYAKYLLSQGILDATTKRDIHTIINDSLKNLLLTSLHVDTSFKSSVFKVTENDITSLDMMDTPPCTNCIAGSIPEAIGNLTALAYLKLSNIASGLTGPIPETLGNLTALTYLNFNNNKLSGSIPEAIGNLKSLTSLNIGSNQLSDSIPEAIGNLTALTYLNLGTNQLSESIPVAIGKLIKLNYLNFSFNRLTGSIPQEIKTLTNLNTLKLNNNLLSKTIPMEVGLLTKLTTLYLQNNQLMGDLTAEIGKLKALTSLDVSGNQLEGSIPPEIENLTHLENLYYTGNTSLSLSYDTKQKLTALKTSDVFSLAIESTGLSTSESITITLNDKETLTITGNKTTNFQTLFASNDSFTLKTSSVSPSMICTLSQTTGTITQNLVATLTCERRMLQLSGTIEFDVKAPSSLAVSMDDSSPTTFSRSIANNKVIPFTFSNIVYGSSYTIKTTDNTVEFNCTPPDTQTLNNDVSDLKITCKNTVAGSIFSYVQDGNTSSLSTLLAKAENIRVMDIRIPSTGDYKDAKTILGTETSVYLYIKYLLGTAKLGSTIGASIPAIHALINTSLENLIFKDLTVNSTLTLSNPISSYFAVNQTYDIVAINCNTCTNRGFISTAIGNLTELNNLIIYQNQLTGVIPHEIGNLKKLGYMALGSNLTGEIPTEIGNLTNLGYLDLAYNNLSGNIPSSMGKLINLGRLSLYGNSLTGNIAEIGNLKKLKFLNITNNKLTGVFPETLTALTEFNCSYTSSISISDTVYARFDQSVLPYIGCRKTP